MMNMNPATDYQFSANATLDSPDRVDNTQAQVPQKQNLPPAPIDGSVDKWFFISGAAC